MVGFGEIKKGTGKGIQGTTPGISEGIFEDITITTVLGITLITVVLFFLFSVLLRIFYGFVLGQLTVTLMAMVLTVILTYIIYKE